MPAAGADLAGCLAGAWRAAPEPLALSARELARAAPALAISGAGALAWRRAKRAPALAACDAAAPLQAAARRQALEHRVQAAALADLDGLLAAAALTGVVFKGAVAALSYAEPWTRPAGDIDLMVRPADLAAVRRALAPRTVEHVTVAAAGEYTIAGGVRPYKVDLHPRLDAVYRLAVDEVFAGAVPFHGALKAPSPEDHLRIVAVHMLKHGAWRPLWLCDLAAMVETAGPGFDWPRALGDDPRLAGWISAAIAAAGELLGCRLDHTPVREPAPRWLVRAILAGWADPDPARYRPPRLGLVRAPRAWLAARWPDPVRGAFLTRGRADGRLGGLRRLRCFVGGLGEGMQLRLARLATPAA